MSPRSVLRPALNGLRQTATRRPLGAAAGLLRPYSFAAAAAARRPLRQATAPAPPPTGAGRTRRYSQQPDGSKIWSFEDVQTLTQDSRPKVVIVDVREPGELKSTGHIPNAINIPVTSAPDSFHISEDEFEDRFGYPRPGKEEEVVFYCKAGVRSRAAAALARSAGWTKVGEYPGSWVDWAGKGGKVQR